MKTTLLNHLQTVFTPSVSSELAQLNGETVSATQKAMNGLLPALTSGVIDRASGEEGAETLYGLLQRTPFATDPSVGQLVDTTEHRQQAIGSGNGLLAQLFEERAGRLVKVISQYSGVGTNSAKNMASLVMSVLMGYLHQQLTARNLTQPQLTAFLKDEAVDTRQAIPVALVGLLDGFITMGRGRPAAVVTPSTVSAPAGEAERSGGMPAWLKWALVALGLLLLLLLLTRGCHRDEPPTSGIPTDSSTVAASDTVASDLDGNGPATNDTTAGEPQVRVGVDLPGGRRLNVVENSFNYSLARYLAEKNRQTPKVFTFDNLTFEPNSARITAQARPHVNDLIQLMQAYPSLAIRIEGNTDSTGDDAINDPLSGERAESVRQALIQAGIAASRVSTREQGDRKPVASNQTASGRQQNRRIDVVITKL